MVEVLWTARYDYEPGWTLSPHHHPFFQIIYCLGGRGTLMLTGHSHTLAPRTLFLIAPAHLHGLVAASAVKTLDIKFRVRDAQLRRALMRLRRCSAAPMRPPRTCWSGSGTRARTGSRSTASSARRLLSRC